MGSLVTFEPLSVGSGVGAMASALLMGDAYLDKVSRTKCAKGREYGLVSMRRRELNIILHYIMNINLASLPVAESNKSISVAAHRYL